MLHLVQAGIEHTWHGHTVQLSAGLSVKENMLIVSSNPVRVNEKEDGVDALHLHIGPFKTCSRRQT